MKTNAARTKAYAPAPFHPALEVTRLKKESPDFALAWDAQAAEFEALDTLPGARKLAGLTQAQVAEAMGVKQPSLFGVFQPDEFCEVQCRCGLQGVLPKSGFDPRQPHQSLSQSVSFFSFSAES